MAKYRQVQISFWQDPFVLDLPPEEKFFYLYLMTNSKTTQCGIYELPLKVLEMETGLSSDRIFELLYKFVGYKKIQYNEDTREVFLLNWLKHNSMKSPKVRACAVKELEEVKHIPYVHEFAKLSKQYGYPIDSLSIDSGEEEEQEKEQKQEEEQEQNPPAPVPINRHGDVIQESLKKYNVEYTIKHFEDLQSFVGTMELDVILHAIGISEGKSAAYAASICQRYLKEGKTKLELVKGGQANEKHGTSAKGVQSGGHQTQGNGSRPKSFISRNPYLSDEDYAEMREVSG